MAGDLRRITAERIRDEFTKLLLRRRPGRRPAAARRHRAGRGVPAGAARAAAGDRRARPAQGRLRAHADRGAQRGRGSRTDGPGPRAAAGRAAARHRQAGDQGGRAGRPGQLPPPRGGRRPADPAADEGAALPEGRHRRRRPSWSRCTCASTATAAASGPTRRCAATSPTPGRC